MGGGTCLQFPGLDMVLEGLRGQCGAAPAPARAPFRGDPVRLEVVLAAQILITYWAGNHTCGPERGYVMSACSSACSCLACSAYPLRCRIKPCMNQGRRRCAALRPALPRRALPWRGPPGAPAPSPRRAARVITSAQAVHPAGTAGSHLPRLRLFSSRRPSQGRLRHRWRDSAATGPDTAPAPVGSGTCEGDGRD
jgi:hypothetical protein